MNLTDGVAPLIALSLQLRRLRRSTSPLTFRLPVQFQLLQGPSEIPTIGPLRCVGREP